MPLTNDDKRNIVLIYFRIPGNENKSNNAVSKELLVSVPFIKTVREEAGIKPSPCAHVGVGAKKNLNGLNNSVKPEGGKDLNRLNKSAPKAELKIINLDLPDDDKEQFAVALLRHFKPAYLKSCGRYLDEIF